MNPFNQATDPRLRPIRRFFWRSFAARVKSRPITASAAMTELCELEKIFWGAAESVSAMSAPLARAAPRQRKIKIWGAA